MPGNTIGNVFRLTTFGESHGKAIGGVIDGCPAGLHIDLDFIKGELDRRKPDYPGSTPRRENDEVEFLSGIKEGTTLGTPIGFIICNNEQINSDYAALSDAFRPSHADFTYFAKYGDAGTGGGRASGRETAARVTGGAIAKLLLRSAGVRIQGQHVLQAGDNASDSIAKAMETGDTLGGTVTCIISGAPAGLGEPVFDKLQADLAKAMLSIGSAKAFEYGLGFAAASMKGSEYNDQMTAEDGKVVYLTNHDGGIQGGISNGQEIYFRVGFKPVPSVKSRQQTVNRAGEAVEIELSGRHDTCHVPRLVVVVESMAALVMADHLLMCKLSRI